MIERILSTEFGFSLPSDPTDWTSDKFQNEFGKAISMEVECVIFHHICEHMNPDDGAMEYKISITVEKSKAFKRCVGEWIE